MTDDHFLYIPQSVAWRTDISDKAKLVYGVLAMHALTKGQCWPARATIARCMAASERTVSDALTELEKAGLVERRRRQRQSTIYILTVGESALIPAGKKILDEQKSSHQKNLDEQKSLFDEQDSAHQHNIIRRDKYKKRTNRDLDEQDSAHQDVDNSRSTTTKMKLMDTEIPDPDPACGCQGGWARNPISDLSATKAVPCNQCDRGKWYCESMSLEGAKPA